MKIISEHPKQPLNVLKNGRRFLSDQQDLSGRENIVSCKLSTINSLIKLKRRTITFLIITNNYVNTGMFSPQKS